MRKKLILLLIVFLPAQDFLAQYNNDFSEFKLHKRSVNLKGEYELNSNAITNHIFNSFLYGGYIDNPSKSKTYNRLTGFNRAGGHSNINLSAFFGKAQSNITYVIGIKQQNLFNTGFSPDLIKLLFSGNKQYEGGTANMSNSSIQYFSFQELKFGVISSGIDTNKAHMGLCVSYLRGQDLILLQTNNTSLYTAPNALSLSLNTNATLSLNSAKNNQSCGNGASVEFFAELPYASKLGNSLFFLSVNNLGFIRWNNQTANYSTDSIYHFSGIHIENLFNVKDSTFKEIKWDSVLKKETNYSRNIVSTNLPTSLYMEHRIMFSKWYSLTNGFRYLFHANYKPYIFIENTFNFSDKFQCALHVGYGGYGRMNYGISANMKLSNAFYLRAGSNSLQGFISPKNSLGQGAFCSLSYRLKS